MKKRRPPKAQRPIVKRPEAVVLPKESEAPVWGWFKKLGSIGAVLALIFTVLRFWPQLSIEPTAAAEPSNPFSGYFRITNEQVYSLTNVGIEVSLRCARIGRGDYTAPMVDCRPSMNNSKQLWRNHTLEPHEPYEITPGDLIFTTPGALLYAQISFSFRTNRGRSHIT